MTFRLGIVVSGRCMWSIFALPCCRGSSAGPSGEKAAESPSDGKARLENGLRDRFPKQENDPIKLWLFHCHHAKRLVLNTSCIFC